MTPEERQEYENRMRRFDNGLNHLLEVQAKTETIVQNQAYLMNQVLEALARLANTANAHEQRIGRLEDRG